MGLAVVGTGFGRTGTESMRRALNMLGFGPTHHMLEIIEKPAEEERWQALAKGGAADWDVLFDGYGSCVDWPSAFYWRQLIKVYPAARVLLSWRSAESWWTSFSRTILKVLMQTRERDHLGVLRIAEATFGGRPDDRAHAIRTYEAHVEAVMATVPEDRLLVHRLGDGWAPLCTHLGVAVPAEAYPSGNAEDQFFASLRGDYER